MNNCRRLISIGIGALLSISTFLTVIPQTEITVYADGDKTISGLCTGTIGDPTPSAGGWSYVYYGQFDKDNDETYEPTLYRVLDKASTDLNSADDNTVNRKTMLLDCDSTLINKVHYSQSEHEYGENGWTNSEINTWLNGENFYGNTNVFTAREKAAIAESTKGEKAEGDDGSGWSSLGYASLEGEHVFLLDAVEATRPSYGYKNTEIADNTRTKSGTSGGYWWLRSPSHDDCSVGLVEYTGRIYENSANHFNNGVSPAFNLNLESVIFSSLIPNTTNEYKLTVKDTNMTIAQTGGSDVTRAGNVVTVPYTITGGAPTQVSVLITEEEYSAGIVPTSGYWYQKLNVETLGTFGTGTFTIPNTYAGQTCGEDYYAYILAEAVNGTYETDYASAPVEITIPDAKPTLKITANDQFFPYDGQIHGPGDAVYEDPAEIAEMVTVEGLQSGDTLTSIEVDGQGKEVGDHDLIPAAATVNGSNASDKYDVTYVNGKLHITSDEKSYNVTFKVKNGAWNDGTKADKTVTLSGNAGDTLKLSAGQIPAAGSKPDTHYKKGSWDVTPDTRTVITSDTTYTYTYANEEKCRITFKANGGKGKMDPQTAEKGDTVRLNANKFTRSGYTFKNWNTKADGSGKSYDDKQSVNLEKNMTLYAQWKAKKYTVTVKTEGKGTATADLTSAKADKKVKIKAIPKAGQKFRKWKITKGVKLDDATKASTSFKMPRKNVTVTAVFEKIYKAPQTNLKTEGKDTIIFAWWGVKDAEGYDIFMSRCNHGGKEYIPRKIKTINDNRITSWTVTGLEHNKSYKGYVKAYITGKNGKKQYISKSPTMHVYTAGGTDEYTNAKSVKIDTSDGKIKNNVLTLKVKGTYNIKASVKGTDKKKILVPNSHISTLRYRSSDDGIASVSAKGKITAKRKGKCSIYVYAHNGVNKTIKVTVE